MPMKANNGGGGETMDDVALFVLQVRIVIDK
jgi:hypothetical protein